MKNQRVTKYAAAILTINIEPLYYDTNGTEVQSVAYFFLFSGCIAWRNRTVQLLMGVPIERCNNCSWGKKGTSEVSSFQGWGICTGGHTIVIP